MTALGLFMASVTANIGELVDRIATAIAGYGQYMISESTDVTSMNSLATAWFSADSNDYGVIYFWNEKFVWWLVQLNDTVLFPTWTGFEGFLTALSNAGLI
jgi:hypothetical protein